MSKLIENPRAIGKVVFVGITVILIVSIVALGFIMSMKVAELQGQLNSLQTSKNDLQSQYNELKTSDDALAASNNNLKASYDTLNGQYQTLLSRFPAGGKFLTIDAIDKLNVELYATYAGIVNVTVRNHYESTVHVTSLKLYDGTALITSVAVLVTIPTNSSTTIHEYVSWGGWNGGNPYSLKVETLEGFTAISDPIYSNR